MDKEKKQQTDEIKSERGYYRQVFASQTDKKKNIARLYQNPVFYNNKLRVGDGELGMRKIDYTLSFNETKKAWTFEYNNYLPFIPEYADKWIDLRDLFFDKDTTIGMRSVAKHVKGRLVKDLPGISNGYNAVIYDDAFGKGIDLIVHPVAVGLRKLVRVREYARDRDLTFDFELNLPKDLPSIISASKKETKKGEDLKSSDTINIIGGKKILIGTESNTSNETFTYINPIRVWDSGIQGENSGQKTEIVGAQILNLDGKKILRKTITAKFLKDAVGDVFTDSSVSIQESKDTYYGTVYTTGGAPDATTLNIGGWGDYYYSYIEWNLAGSPIVASECLISLMVAGVAVNSPLPTIRRVSSTWTEAGVTLAAHPTENSTTIATLTNPITIGVGNRDEQAITSLYNSWKDNTYDNYGIKIHSGSNNNTASNYYSSDHVTAGNRPYLEVTYTALTVITGVATNITSTTLTANGNLTSSGTSYVTRRGFVYDTSSHADPGNTDPDVSAYATVLDNKASTNPLLIQKGAVVMESGGSAAFTITLDTPVPVGKSFPLISGSTNVYNAYNSTAYIELRGIVGSNYTQVYVYKPYNTSNCTFQWQVISGNDLTVQDGIATMANLTQLDVTITAVNQTKAFAIGSSVCNNSGWTAGMFRCKLTSDTNLRINAGNSTTYSYFRWYVVEWTGATVQAGEWEFDGTVEANGIHNVPINAVDLSKTFVLWTNSMTNFSTNPGIIKTQVSLTSATNLRLYKRLYYGSGTYGACCYYVISHPNLSVTHGNGNTTEMTYTSGTLPLDETKTFVATTQIGNSNCSTNANTVTQRGISSDRVINLFGGKFYQAARGEATDSIYPAWMVVEDQGERFNPGTFTKLISGLSVGNIIYIRTFVKNTDGYVYGSELQYTIPFPVSVNDSMGLSGSVTVDPLGCPATVSDTVTVGENLVFSTTLYPITVDDSISISEQLFLYKYDSIFISDSISLSEDIGRDLLSFVDVSDSISLSELILTTGEIFGSTNDTIEINEGITSSSISFASVQDGISINELINGAFSTSSISISDTVTLGELVNTILSVGGISVNDTITIEESVTVGASIPSILISDTVNLNELVSIGTIIGGINIADSISISESAIASIPSFISISDSLSLSELVTTSGNIFTFIDDSLSITENIKIFEQSFIKVNDSLSIAESVISRLGMTIVKMDTVTVTDVVSNMLLEINASVVDNITLIENLLRQIGDLNISKQETLTVNESINTPLISIISIIDNLNLSESIVSKIGDLSISKTDSLAISENINRILTLLRSVSDTLTISESVLTEIELTISEVDTITINENLVLQLNRFLSVIESLSISEVITTSISDLTVVKYDNLSISESVLTKMSDLVVSTQDYSSLLEDIHITLASLVSVFDIISVSDNVSINTQRYSPMIQKNRPRGSSRIQDRIGKIYIPSNRGGITPSRDLRGIIR